MKTKLLKLKMMIVTLGMLFLTTAQATTFTASTSGNWSSAATWGGMAVGANISNDDIVIPNGITVNMDMNVTFSTTLVNSVTVNGTLNSTTHELIISQGTLAGAGTINIMALQFGGLLAASTFTGHITVNSFINNGATLQLGAIISTSDTLDLSSGSIALGSGANLTLMSNSTIKIDAGTMSISGGIFNSNNNYNVLYVGATKASGIELNSTSLQNVSVNLSSNTQSVSLSSDLNVYSNLNLNSGSLNLNGNQLSLYGDLHTTSGAMLTSDQTSNIVIQTSNSITSALIFTGGSAVNNLSVNISNSGSVKLMSALAVSGQLQLTKGSLSLQSSSTLTMNANSTINIQNGSIAANGGNFVGTVSYNVEYTGGTNTSSVELTGTGLSDVTVNLTSTGSQINLSNNTTANGTFTMTMGSLNLNGHNLTLTGTYNQTATASFIGNTSSELHLNLSSSNADTLHFSNTNQILAKLIIDPTAWSSIMLGSNLSISNELDLTNGSLDINNYNLTIQSSGTIGVYNDNNYIVTSGSGQLQMNVTSASSYVVFPIGTTINYSPASIQQTASGTSGSFMANVMSGVYAAGTVGANLATSLAVVDRTWQIESASGVTVNTNLKLGWKATSEVNGFDRTTAYISHYTNATWDSYAAASATAGANSTFEISRTGITSLSPFTVTDNSSSLKVNEVSSVADAVELYPNPAADFVNIEVTDAANTYKYELMDVVGRTLAVSSDKYVLNKFEVSNLKTGVYFIRATNLNNNQTVTKRFVKS